MTREHLWSKWMGDAIDASDRSYHFRRRDREGKVLKQWRSPSLDLRARVVCNDCNNGWMSDLDNESRSVIEEMILNGAHQATLDLRALVTIGAFTFKTALIADCMLPEGEDRFFSFAARRQFAESLQIPPSVQMWIATFCPGEYPVGLWRPQYKSIGGVYRGCHFYLFTYVVGRLALQLICSKWAGNSRNPVRAQHPIFEQAHGWNPAVIKFWPLNGNSIRWPTLRGLSDYDIDTFSNRWASLHRPPGNVNLFVSL